MKLQERDGNKTTITSHHGPYTFECMPLNMRDVPSTFPCPVYVTLSRVKWAFALVYLYHTVIFSKSISDHLSHLHSVHCQLSNAGMSLKRNKCFFFDNKFDYPCTFMMAEKLAISDMATDVKRVLWQPTNATEYKTFLILCSSFGRFVPNLSQIAAPQRLVKDLPFILSLDDIEVQVQSMPRVVLLSPSLLASPRRIGRDRLDTCTWNKQFRCLLLEDQSVGPAKAVGYWSRSLNKTENAYATTHSCHCVVWAIVLLRP